MEVGITVQNLELKGILEIPKGADSIVIFAHIGGEQSERNMLVAEELQKIGLSTLLFDLLIKNEDVAENQFNIELITERLIAVTKWSVENEKTKRLKIGYFGSGTGAAAALSSAAYWGTKVKAVVSREGRPDLAMDVLDLIESPTLLIVGGEDREIIDFNRQAYQKMGCIKKTEVVPGGVLQRVAELAGLWFMKYM